MDNATFWSMMAMMASKNKSSRSSSSSSKRSSDKIYPIGGRDPSRPYCHSHRNSSGKVFRHCHD